MTTPPPWPVRQQGATAPSSIAELVDVESRGLYRMALLECCVAYRADREWLARHIATQKLRLAAHIEAGWDAAIYADGAIAYFESRWRVRVDVDLARVDVANADPPPAPGRGSPVRSERVRRRITLDREIEQLVAFRPRKPGIFPTAAHAAPNPSAGQMAAPPHNLYVYDDSLAVGVKPFTMDTARHLARHRGDPYREFVLDRLAPRKHTDRLLAQLLRRRGQPRVPRIPIDDLKRDIAIVSECANAAKPSFPRIMQQFSPDLATRMGYVDGARRPPTKTPPGIQPFAWKTNMDRRRQLRRQLAHRWETLRPWVTPDPDSRPMGEWKPARREELAPVDGVLKYVDKQTEPQVVKTTHKRCLMPGESVEFPRARVRRTVKTIKRR
jgi:hypothetical protein